MFDEFLQIYTCVTTTLYQELEHLQRSRKFPYTTSQSASGNHSFWHHRRIQDFLEFYIHVIVQHTFFLHLASSAHHHSCEIRPCC